MVSKGRSDQVVQVREGKGSTYTCRRIPDGRTDGQEGWKVTEEYRKTFNQSIAIVRKKSLKGKRRRIVRVGLV